MARASVLAAANPTQNSYDGTKTLAANVNLSQPVMSRFDLFFILRDKPEDRALDLAVAQHILKQHKFYDNPDVSETTEDGITQDELRLYIWSAKRLNPKMTLESRRMLVRAYKRLRQASNRKPGAFPVTVRQLESMIRLSEGIARIFLEDTILPEYVEYAFELMQATQGDGVGETITLEMDEEERAEMEEAGEQVEPEENKDQSKTAEENAKARIDFFRLLPQRELFSFGRRMYCASYDELRRRICGDPAEQIWSANIFEIISIHSC